MRGRPGVSIAGAQQITRKEPARYTGTDRVSLIEARPGMRLGLANPNCPASLSETERAQLTGPARG